MAQLEDDKATQAKCFCALGDIHRRAQDVQVSNVVHVCKPGVRVWCVVSVVVRTWCASGVCVRVCVRGVWCACKLGACVRDVRAWGAWGRLYHFREGTNLFRILVLSLP